jgi:hypothetical protein
VHVSHRNSERGSIPLTTQAHKEQAMAKRKTAAGARKGVHFQYNVDLSNPTEKKLEKIKNDLVRKITRNVGREIKTLDEAGPEMMQTHDRHYSIHGRD